MSYTHIKLNKIKVSCKCFVLNYFYTCQPTKKNKKPGITLNLRVDHALDFIVCCCCIFLLSLQSVQSVLSIQFVLSVQSVQSVPGCEG